jgi:hypothetical protein
MHARSAGFFICGVRMSEEQQDLSQEEQDQQEQQAKSAFAAGYNKVRGEEPPAIVEPAETDQDKPVEEEPAAVQQPEPEKPIFAGLTETQLKAKLERIDEIDQLRDDINGRDRRAMGKIGELNRTLQQLQEFNKNSASVTPRDLKHLRDEFPELAELLAKDIGESPDVEKMVSDRVQAATAETIEKVEEKLLTVMHPDWKELANSGEFQSWVGLMKPEEAEALMGSKDGVAVAAHLTKFKAWRDDFNKQKATADEAERQKQDKRQRLEAAAVPNNRTAPLSAEPNASERFRAGYNKVAGARHS